MDVHGFILAGGKSSRMGTDKAFLKISQKTFLEHTAEKLSLFCNSVSVVLSEPKSTLTSKIETIFDVFKGRGALSGIHASFKHCASEFAFILAVDMPLVRAETIASLIDAIRDDNWVDAVLPVEFISSEPKGIKKNGKFSAFRLQPLCAVYRAKRCLPVIEKLLIEPDSVSVYSFLEKVPIRLMKFDDERFFNVNTVEDYQKVLDLWQKQ